MTFLEILESLSQAMATGFFVLWLTGMLLTPRRIEVSPMEREWRKLRSRYSRILEYGEDALARIGDFLARFVSRKSLYHDWWFENRIVPVPRNVYVGYQFVHSLPKAALVTTLFGFLTGLLGLPLWILATSLAAVLITRQRIRKAEQIFQIKLNQLRADLSFAIDVVILYSADEIRLPVRRGLEAVALEFRHSELGDELGLVVEQLKHNCTIEDALRAFHKRWDFDEQIERFKELLVAKDEGNTSTESLQSLALEISHDRRQSLVAKSERAQRKLSFSNILFTYACILLLVAPFLMKIPEMITAF